MPKRTNETQKLVHRLERILHGQGARITESAMVRNRRSGSKEEIDVLISFKVGGRKYRTAIAVRYRHRDRGGPEWIRALAKQKESCGFDKMVAAHTRGFTPAAKRTAKLEGVELVEITQITDGQLLTAVEPVLLLEAFLTFANLFFLRCTDTNAIERLTNGLGTFAERLKPKISNLIQITMEDHLDNGNGKRLSLKKLGSLLRTILEEAVRRKKTTEPTKTETIFYNFVYQICLPTKCYLVRQRRSPLIVTHIFGKATVNAMRARFNQTKRISYGEHRFTVSSDSSSETGAHFTTIEGGPISENVIGQFEVGAVIEQESLPPMLLEVSDIFADTSEWLDASE